MHNQITNISNEYTEDIETVENPRKNKTEIMVLLRIMMKNLMAK